MTNKIIIRAALVSLFFLAVCRIAAAQENPKTPGINQKNETVKIEKYVNLFDFRVVGNSFTENGYTLERRVNANAERENTSAEFAVMRKNGSTVERFDFLNHPFDSIDFGLFSFLGKKDRQIFVSQTAPRSGVHLIIGTRPQFRVLFKNSEWNVGREDFNAIDLDGDSVFELSFESTAFYGFEPERLGNVGAPLTEIVFKYDSSADKFLPANPRFAEFSLRGVDEEIARIRRDNKDFQFADVFAIALRFVYAGKETEAWDFFDRNYNFDDREDLKTKIKAIIKTDAVYQYIYK
jgi:hypothetical protein